VADIFGGRKWVRTTMASLIEEISDSIQRQTLWIANEMGRAKYTGLGIQEETITDVLLNRIQSEHEENFFTRKFSHKEEGSITGADWLWCIGEPGSWITFAVQAKIANTDTGRINHLLYKGGRQYSQLISFSKRYRFIPKYSIYTTVDEETKLFSRGEPELKNISPIQWSFTAISPKYIKKLSKPNERHFSSVLQFAIPWSYVFRAGKSGDAKLADIIANNLESLYWSFDNEYRHQRKEKPRFNYERLVSDNPQPSKMILESIPLPVLYLMTQKISPTKAPISTVSVLSRIPVSQALSVELKKIESSRQWKIFPKVFAREIENIRNGERNSITRYGR
jgi:hypothetical protein